MNDSAFGLTASIWTQSTRTAAIAIGEQVETGTWFMNRCRLPGPGTCLDRRQGFRTGLHALSCIGYEQLTRPKSFHLRTAI